MRILVSGGLGFIGSALIRHCLRQTSHDIVNIDCLTYAGNDHNLDEVLPHARYRLIKADICDRDSVSQIMDEFDPEAVIHLAADSHVDRSIASAAPFIRTNIVGTFELLEAARLHVARLSPTRQKLFRFHHVSTDEVYGVAKAGTSFSETSAYAPNSPYAASKASSDMLVRAWNKTYDLPVLISNSSNNYGPYQFPEKFIPVVVLNGLRGLRIPIYGNGQNIRDWIHVDDHVRALLKVLEQGRPGESYAIGGGDEVANIDLARKICAQLDIAHPSGAPHESLIHYVEDRPGHDARYAINSAKIRDELGWKPETMFNDGLTSTIDWYRDHAEWWMPLLSKSQTPSETDSSSLHHAC